MTQEDVASYLDEIIDSIEAGRIDDTSLVTHLLALVEEVYGVQLLGRRHMAFRAKALEIRGKVETAFREGARYAAADVLSDLEVLMTS